MATQVLTDRAGPCIVITKTTGSITGVGTPGPSWLIPFFDETKFTATQKLKQPVKEFFDDLKDFIVSESSVIGGGGVAGVTDAILKGLDLFGLQLFSKGFYAQAWAGEEPTPFSLTLKFFLGMQGLWDAGKEVFAPVMDIMAHTVPLETGSVFLSAPLPSPLATFTNFSANVLAGISQAAASFGEIVGAGASQFVTSANTYGKSIASVPFGGTWQVAFGWKDNTSGAPKLYFNITNCIVESSTWSFSPMTQLKNNKAYPITGELQLNFRTQTLLTNLSLVDNQATGG